MPSAFICPMPERPNVLKPLPTGSISSAADSKFSPSRHRQTIYFPVDGTRKVDFVTYHPHCRFDDDIYIKLILLPRALSLHRPVMTARIASTADEPLDKEPHTAVVFIFRASSVSPCGEVNVEAGDGFTMPTLLGLPAITLNNQPLKADFELLTDKLTSGSGKPSTITLNTAAANGQRGHPHPATRGCDGTLTFTMKNNSILPGT